ncbi:MAG: hypothetical protein A2521_13850 [Deltaproteobacteria bacterium RIFOXYD12_FULL_57_12]|nr:MAG: hypothetical protein A2521_13850 [Deltaproteobacteria bacterium RIFOXYD12_FULL_57_12]
MYDLTLKHGRPGLPVVVLIHGLGMNRHFWRDAARCPAMGGLGPLTIFLDGKPPANNGSLFSTGVPNQALTGLADYLVEQGYAIAAWSQTQPLGPAAVAVGELARVMARVRETWPGTPVYLVGHSRGGIIARHYLLDTGGREVAGLISIGSPHAGTRLAGYAEYLRPVGMILERLIPDEVRGGLPIALKRLADFLRSPAIRELQPDASYLRDLASPLPGHLRLMSFGGTDPALFRLYVRSRPENPWKVLSLPDLFLKVLPPGRLPAELQPGAGDGLVAAGSAVLAGGRHLDMARNHVGLAFTPALQQQLAEFLEGGAAGRE